MTVRMNMLAQQIYIHLRVEGGVWFVFSVAFLLILNSHKLCAFSGGQGVNCDTLKKLTT